MKRRHFSTALLASAAGASALLSQRVSAAAGVVPAEGRDYTRITPPQAANVPSGKIEVLEFFSYACPHCSSFEPTIAQWGRSLPADVVFRRVPVSFLFNAENFQKTYYTLETLGLVEAMQQKIFAAVHVEKLRLEKPEDIAALVAKNGGDAAKFMSTFKSFSVATSVNRAKKQQADYKIESVPAIAVQGRFLTSPSQAGGAPQALAVTEALVERARKGG